ncbi:MAG: peptidase [Sphingomonas bacterium]|nr:peptidase [Sphingomonas bacterium]
MRWVHLAHRWAGGFVGMLLALSGLTGAILVHKDAWIILPHTQEAQRQDAATLAGQIATLVGGDGAPSSILFATRDFGLSRLTFAGDRGAYASQSGEIVARWDSLWDRPELWLFDLHHQLWAGEVGETIVGIAALIGIGFVVTGIILWWPMRRAFRLRLWPARMTRPAIVRQHRDLGILIAPMLFLSMLTGTVLVLKPVAALLLRPWSTPGEMAEAGRPPSIRGGALSATLDWHAVIAQAQARFPGAEVRVLALPRKPGDLLAMRLRQPAEWLPNGRTMAWFDPANGRLVASRGAETLPKGNRIFNLAYPLHAAKVGGLPYRLLITASGLALAMLGSLAVWSFWTKRPNGRR